MAKTAKTSLTIEPLIIAGLEQPLQLFSTIANQPWAIWLDSCESDHIDAHFDMMVFQPIVTLETRGQTTTISWLGKTTPDEEISENSVSNDDPLALLEQVQQQVFSEVTLPESDLPFIGGSIGYFSYDLGRRFEQLPAQAVHDVDMPEMAVGIYQQAIIYDRKKQQFLLLCPAEKRTQLTQSFNEKINLLENTRAKDKAMAFSLTTDWQTNMSKSEYSQKFNQVQDYLLSGDCYQINLAQRFQANYQGDEFLAYLALRNENQAPFSAFMRFYDAAVLSVSPERFLKLEHKVSNKHKYGVGHVQSKPIKGTKPRSVNKIIDEQNALALAHSEKDRAENLMIVDLLRNDISKVCLPGSVKVPKLFDVESFPAVHHLVSTVTGELAAEFSATDLLRGAFPGGSITGAPKIRAMEVIDELEPHQRSVYCGAIGYISACGNMDTSITIRTLACKNNTIYCWAGGGLVADSTAESEYQETFDKVAKILPVLAKYSQ